MGYYVRAFCTSPQVPTVRQVLEAIKEKGFDLQLDNQGIDLDSPDWDQLALLYKKGKKPILVECNRDVAEPSLCRDEIAGFLEEIRPLADSPAKTCVIEHLQNTKFIIACQLPVLNMGSDETGYRANDAFVRYFEQHCGGLIQADGEGFFQGQELLLEME